MIKNPFLSSRGFSGANVGENSKVVKVVKVPKVLKFVKFFNLAKTGDVILIRNFRVDNGEYRVVFMEL